MEPLSSSLAIVFVSVLTIYALAMLVIGFVAQRRIQNVEDYVVAGRQLPTSLATLTIVATWFGAESLMTTTDEVSQRGMLGAMLDPFGISLCLLIAGLFIAGPVWRLGLLTIPDFFRQRYGKSAEFLSASILVPSYFGWIAAQYLALATLLEQFFGLPIVIGVIGVAALATSYTWMGGMWSVTWTDTVQMLLIVVGLLVLGFEILMELGAGSLWQGVEALRNGADLGLQPVVDAGQLDQGQVDGQLDPRQLSERSSHAMWMAAVSALVIGSLGNLPVQDLLQRICSARSDQVARRACLWGAIGYLALGVFPILAGLSAAMILHEGVPNAGVVTLLAARLLNPALLLIFVLAIVSIILSTVVSAVLAPAAVLGQNLIGPFCERWSIQLTEERALRHQRLSVLFVVVASTIIALLGEGTYELVESSYSLSLVGLFAPFVLGLYTRSTSTAAALISMSLGVGCWLLHLVCGWETFLEPWMPPRVPQDYRWLTQWPHELVAACLSIVAFLGVSCWSPSAVYADGHNPSEV